MKLELRALSGALLYTIPSNPGVKPAFAKVTESGHRERMEHEDAPNTNEPWSNLLSIFSLGGDAGS